METYRKGKENNPFYSQLVARPSQSHELRGVKTQLSRPKICTRKHKNIDAINPSTTEIRSRMFQSRGKMIRHKNIKY